MMLSNWFKREKTVKVDETHRMATLSLQGRAEQLLEDLAARNTRYSKPIPQSTSRYYNY
jgi:hypothetical protein